MKGRFVLALGTACGLGYWLLGRPWLLHSQATRLEAGEPLPGDDLAPNARYLSTRAIAIQAPPEAVWPWLVQLGQGRGGFYTYDRLEQLFGADIRSADHIVPELQNLTVGDVVRLSAEGGPSVVRLEPSRVLVLHDAMDVRTGRSIAAGSPAEWALHWSWSYVLRPLGAEGTRLLVRTRAGLSPRGPLTRAALLLLEPVHFAMERRVLQGIKRRAEQQGSSPDRQEAPFATRKARQGGFGAMGEMGNDASTQGPRLLAKGLDVGGVG